MKPWPSAYSWWVHKKTGNRYTVLHLTNTQARKDGWPVMVVYIDEYKDIWSRPVEEFLEKFNPA